jgi:hypothetical protein
MSDVLADEFALITDRADDSDWHDVCRRADEISCRAHTSRPPTRVLPRRTQYLLAAAVLIAAVVVAPALAFSTTVRQLVGLSSSPPVIQRWVQATLTGTIIQNPNPRPGTMITITWTIGEPGKLRDPGFGGTGLFMRLLSKTGAPTRRTPAHGARGRYSATTRVPPGGIRNIQLGVVGYSDGPTGHHAAPGLFPITNNPY